MNKYILTISISFLCFFSASAQVVVKMAMPEQPSQALSASTLFDEILPTNIPVVLGPMGYDIVGGKAPYTFQWYENETLLTENDIAMITLSDEDRYTVVIRDANNCSVTLPLVTDRAIGIDDKNLQDRPFHVYYSQIDGQLYIQSHEKSKEINSLILYDVKGVKIWEEKLEGSGGIRFTQPSGIYFLTIIGNNHYQIEKIIVP